jgi:hypothetical protein
MGTYHNYPGALAVPYGVSDTEGKYSIVKSTRCLLLVFLSTLYNRVSNEVRITGEDHETYQSGYCIFSIQLYNVN